MLKLFVVVVISIYFFVFYQVITRINDRTMICSIMALSFCSSYNRSVRTRGHRQPESGDGS